MIGREELLDAGNRLKRNLSRGPVLDFVEGAVEVLRVRVSDAVVKAAVDCPVCAARRASKREAQRKWRRKGGRK